MKIEVLASGKFGTEAAPGQRACWCRYSEGIQVGTLRVILHLEPEKIQEENSDYQIISTTESNILACCKTKLLLKWFPVDFGPLWYGSFSC